MRELLNNRKTVRSYNKDIEVKQELIKELLGSAGRSATTGNMQLYSVVENRDPDMLEQLAAAHFNQPVSKNAPVTLTFCADFNRFNKWCVARGAEPGYDNFLSFMTASIDALLYAQTFSLLAEKEGLGTCYLGTAIYNADKIIDMLKLPKGVVPVATIAIGWPNDDSEQVDRLDVDAMFHSETYSDYSDLELDDIYREKEAREDSKKFVEENAKESLAHVFTDIRYNKANNEHFSNVLLKVIKDQGFLD